MKPSDWKKAAAIKTAQVKAAKTEKLETFPLSELAMDESGPPELLPTAPQESVLQLISHDDSQSDQDYQDIIPGTRQAHLYPLLSSLEADYAMNLHTLPCYQDTLDTLRDVDYNVQTREAWQRGTSISPGPIEAKTKQTAADSP